MMTDYLIVGAGLAGLAFADKALSNGKSIVVFDDDRLRTSSTAAGVFNPVILKRYSILSDAQNQLDRAESFFTKAETTTGSDFRFPMPIYRRLATPGEQNDWFVAADKPNATPFLSTDTIVNSFPGISADFGFGEVLQTGYVDTGKFVDAYRAYLKSQELLRTESFDYDVLKCSSAGVSYKGISAKRILFAEGYAINDNPFFNWLPLAGTKGEILTVRIPGLQLNAIIKGGVFVLPVGDDVFRIGATYEWTDKTETPSAEAREQLLSEAAEIVRLPLEVIDHKAGIRPTTKDRKPLIGKHPEFPQIALLNGLGTRGVMLGPYCANLLWNHLENGMEIPQAYHLNRFLSLYPQPDRS